MSEPRRDDTVAAKPRTFIGKTFDFFSRMIGVMLFSAFLSVIMEWVCIGYFYPEGTGYTNSQEMMRKELAYLGMGDGQALSDNRFAQEVSGAVGGAVTFLFVDSGLINSLSGLANPTFTGNEFIDFFKKLGADYYVFMVSAIYILGTFCIRLGILVLSVPAFILFAIVGVSDGLAKRDLRRWCGGNESGYIYHWAKRFTTPVLFAAWVIYLSIPYSIHPNFIITPFAALYGFVVMVMASKFKKYL
ncbi:hypothetical protein DOK_11756 [gamma proteobacterium BDW918]|nr:hypothetical protein DOK_11756 [gamma proteobacterium BDW918]